MDRVESLLKTPTVENVLSLTNELNQIVQQPVAQLEKVSETLSAIYHCDINQIEEFFKYSAIVRTNWASHVILL